MVDSGHVSQKGGVKKNSHASVWPWVCCVLGAYPARVEMSAGTTWRKAARAMATTCRLFGRLVGGWVDWLLITTALPLLLHEYK